MTAAGMKARPSDRRKPDRRKEELGTSFTFQILQSCGLDCTHAPSATISRWWSEGALYIAVNKRGTSAAKLQEPDTERRRARVQIYRVNEEKEQDPSVVENENAAMRCGAVQLTYVKQ